MDTAPKTAPKGTTIIVMKSIHEPTMGSASRNTPTPKAMRVHISMAVFLFSLNLVCHDSLTASNIFIRLVIPAKTTDMKNSTANMRPKGICLNMPGSVMNISGGPELGSMPKANTAGIMARAASMAAMVSNTAVLTDALGMSSLLERYVPYTIIPEPVMDREKKACPMAMTHVSISSSLLQSGTNRNSYPR